MLVREVEGRELYNANIPLVGKSFGSGVAGLNTPVLVLRHRYGLVRPSHILMIPFWRLLARTAF